MIGKTDRKGAYPVTTPYHPNDLGATIYNALGIDVASNVPDRLDRPRRLNDGEVIEPYGPVQARVLPRAATILG